jgi:hypothetical protein
MAQGKRRGSFECLLITLMTSYGMTNANSIAGAISMRGIALVAYLFLMVR